MRLRRRQAIAVAGIVALAAVAAVVLRARFAIPRAEPMVTASGRRLTGFCAAAVQLHCNKRIECGQMHRQQLAACIDEVGAECERSIGWKLRAGVLTTGGEPQEECFEGMAAAGCNALQFLLGDDEPGLLEITDRCELLEMFQPHSGIGAACAETSDCTAGFCPGLAPECHRCRAFAGPGEACRPGEQLCDPARAFCAGAASGEMKCQPLLPDGVACTNAHQCRGGACRTSGDGSGARSCAGAAAGTPCADLGDCGDGFYCRLDGDRRTCAPRVKTGERCGDDPGACAEAEARCVAGRCRVRPFTLGRGAVCHDFSDCKDGLYCKGTRGAAGAGRCAALGAAGTSCHVLDFGACRADAACIGGRCRRLGTAGEGCAGPYQCKAFLSCVPNSPDQGFAAGGTCVPNPGMGQACNPYLPCVASSCDGATGKCVPLGAGGAHCLTSEQCESGWCVGPAGAGLCYSPCLPEAARTR